MPVSKQIWKYWKARVVELSKGDEWDDKVLPGEGGWSG